MKTKNETGFYNERTLSKFKNMYEEICAMFCNPEIGLVVSISKGNVKMGDIPSVSLPPYFTCPSSCISTCAAKCYAAKICNLRPNVLASYSRNLYIAIHHPDVYWSQVKAAMRKTKWFRFHVSGDFLNYEYFLQTIKACEECPDTQVLCFTKRFEYVNKYLNGGNTFPSNLHLLLSGWENLTPDNPFRLPETNVIMKGAEKKQNWILCGGNCTACANAGAGCWGVRSGDTIAFPIH